MRIARLQLPHHQPARHLSPLRTGRSRGSSRGGDSPKQLPQLRWRRPDIGRSLWKHPRLRPSGQAQSAHKAQAAEEVEEGRRQHVKEGEEGGESEGHAPAATASDAWSPPVQHADSSTASSQPATLDHQQSPRWAEGTGSERVCSSSIGSDAPRRKVEQQHERAPVVKTKSRLLSEVKHSMPLTADHIPNSKAHAAVALRPASRIQRTSSAPPPVDHAAVAAALRPPPPPASPLHPVSDQCLICGSKIAEVVFLHDDAVHRCCCRGCATGMAVGGPCPQCDAPVVAILRVYSAAARDSAAPAALVGVAGGGW
jgi:hypothetical protein